MDKENIIGFNVIRTKYHIGECIPLIKYMYQKNRFIGEILGVPALKVDVGGLFPESNDDCLYIQCDCGVSDFVFVNGFWCLVYENGNPPIETIDVVFESLK